MKEQHREHALALAAVIEANEQDYDQTYFVDRMCGTPACIAGWSAALSQDAEHPETVNLVHKVGISGHDIWNSEHDIWNTARRSLGLSKGQAHTLFDQDPFGKWADFPSAADAAATLRHYAETGKVDWRRAE